MKVGDGIINKDIIKYNFPYDNEKYKLPADLKINLAALVKHTSDEINFCQ